MFSSKKYLFFLLRPGTGHKSHEPMHALHVLIWVLDAKKSRCEGWWIAPYIFAELWPMCPSFFWCRIESVFTYAQTSFLHHESLWLIHAPAEAEWLRNPLSNSVQLQEDYVGKPSRLSRRVAVPQVHKRVMDRSLISSYQAILASDADERGLVWTT